MTMSLSGRACIVTGAGRGIGRATALRLTASGANVIATSRTARDLEEVVASTLSSPGRCVAQITDVTKPDQVERLIGRCQEEFGRLDALINNAGIAPSTPFEQMADKDFDHLLSVNICSVFYACRSTWKLLKSSHGTIINISSVAAQDPFPGFAAYGGTKAWVETFSRAIANEAKSAGIKVFVVAPGAVETQMLRGPFPDFPADKALQPDDVAGLIEWLLDHRCTHVSGEVLTIKR
jgi:NAD(P)-dependent dehydrogenase (short-subunit alcohol dehydrogenase family)